MVLMPIIYSFTYYELTYHIVVASVKVNYKFKNVKTTFFLFISVLLRRILKIG